MELYPTHIALINAKLPARYKLDQIAKNEFRPVSAIQRRSEAENLDFNVRFQPKAPIKRIKSEKPLDIEEPEEPALRLPKEQQLLLGILSEIQKHPRAKAFLYPVNRSACPDYYEKVKKPMDLSTVEQKILKEKYETTYHFSLDMRLIWSNSFLYNPSNSPLYSAAEELSFLFEKLMKGTENFSLDENKDSVSQQLYKKTEKASQGLKEMQNKPKPPKPSIEKPMSYIEKKQLCEDIKRIKPKYLKGVLDIVKECTDIKGEELEFDIDKLPPRICRELEQYTKNCLQGSSSAGINKAKMSGEEIKSSQEQMISRINDMDSGIEGTESNANNEVYLPENSEASSESSSTSESEEEIPSSIAPVEQFNERSECSTFFQGFGTMIDKDNKFY